MYTSIFNQRNNSVTALDKIFDDLIKKQFPEMHKETGLSFSQGSYPKANVIDFDDRVKIVAEVAGLEKNDIKVDVEGYVLTISGDSNIKFNENGVYLLKELKHSSFKRSFTFGDKFDMERIIANFNDGILVIEVMKKDPEPKISKQIEIISKDTKKILKD